MTRTLKLLLGAASFAPLLVLVYCLFGFFWNFTSVVERGGSVPQGHLEGLVSEMATVILIVVAATVLLLGFYFWHLLVHRARRELDGQVLWGLLLLLVPVVAMPAYWLLHIWPDEAAGRRAAPARQTARTEPG